jgi:anti-anti-sigma factor
MYYFTRAAVDDRSAVSKYSREVAEQQELFIYPGNAPLVAHRSIDRRCRRFDAEGVIDRETAPWLTALLAASCTDPEVDAVALDLRQVTFLGAAGLRCLDATARLAARHGVRFSVSGALPFLRRILQDGDLDPSITLDPPGV